MASEKHMRGQVVRALRSRHAVPVENAVGAGTPDVNYAEGWIELKHIDKWPKKDSTIVKVPHFTKGQKMWLKLRSGAGGRAWVLLKVRGDWCLLDGKWAAEYLGEVDKEELMENVVWEGKTRNLCELKDVV